MSKLQDDIIREVAAVIRTANDELLMSTSGIQLTIVPSQSPDRFVFVTGQFQTDSERVHFHRGEAAQDVAGMTEDIPPASTPPQKGRDNVRSIQTRSIRRTDKSAEEEAQRGTDPSEPQKPSDPPPSGS